MHYETAGTDLESFFLVSRVSEQINVDRHDMTAAWTRLDVWIFIRVHKKLVKPTMTIKMKKRHSLKAQGI